MSKINVRSFSNENDDGAPDIVGVSTFSSTAYFVPTKGTTAQRPSDHVEVGSIRFNTDTSNLEFYRGHGVGWSQFDLIDPDLGGGTGSNTGLGTRGLFVGGYSPASVGDIEFITISTLGNSQDFGDLTDGYNSLATTNDRTRGFANGGQIPATTANMRFCTLASTGNATDAGDLTVATKGRPAGISDSTRGVILGGRDSSNEAMNNIQYHTIQSTGNAADFGDLLSKREFMGGMAASSTRGLVAGGYDDPGARVNIIEFVTTKTLGNSTDFGDLSYVANAVGAASNSTRAIFAGGRTPADENSISFVTIATTGNASDFGDLTGVVDGDIGMVTSPTRAVFGGGGAPNGGEMTYVEIATTGNAAAFGELTVAKTNVESLQEPGCWSTGHGGL